MTTFQNGMVDAMRNFAADNQTIVNQTNPGTAAGLYGQAGAQFMAAMFQAGDTAGIDPALLAAAFDQAGQAIDLTSQFDPANVPTAPDWSQIPDGSYKSLLVLQYDLMLVHLIDLQTVAGLTPPLTQADLASISTQDLANRAAIRQGLQGLSATQMDALMAALSPPHFFL